MNVSLKTLNTYVNIEDQDPKILADKITAIGLEVEGMHPLAKGNDLVVGYIHSCKMHPDSDHLHVCQVEIAPDTIVQIVCGAPNVADKQKVIVAKIGCDLGDGCIIRQSSIRGQDSSGMICSLLELGIDGRFLSEEQKKGIEILPSDAPIGKDALSYLGLDDMILEIGLTPNRSDCLALTALAYEVGALLHRPVRLPEITYQEDVKSDISMQVETDLCSFFGLKVVKGVQNKRSPLWLSSALLANGMKPVNVVVDIANYVMLETGQPIHMYDYDKLLDKQFMVTTGKAGTETMLDGQEYTIDASDIVVMIGDTVGSIAGVMGSEATKIDENTTNIVIEVATFHSATIRHTARRLHLLTDAATRFTKEAINTAQSSDVLERCANLLVTLAKGKEVSQSITSSYVYEKTIVTLSTERVNHVLGTQIEAEIVEGILQSLQFTYELKDDVFSITIPSYRKDITMEADMIEEVARMYGYDKIPTTLPVMETKPASLTKEQAKIKEIKHILQDLGLHETITYTLTSQRMVTDFNLFHPDDTTIDLQSPLSNEHSVTRKSLIPSLLEAIQYNQAHANKDVHLFEFSTTYSPQKEVQTLAIASTGAYHPVHFKHVNYASDYYLLKGFFTTIMEQLGIRESRYRLVPMASDAAFYHPGRSAYVRMGKETVGVIGAIHPAMEKKYGVQDVYTLELDMSHLLSLPTSSIHFQPVPMYPSISRDIALVMDTNVATYDVIRKIKQASKQLVKEATIFDVYEGEHMEAGKKSVAISLTFQNAKETLKEETVNTTMEMILNSLEKEFKAVLRS